jgi:hypothetical protein
MTTKIVRDIAMAIADADDRMYPLGSKCPHVKQAQAALSVILVRLREPTAEMQCAAEAAYPQYTLDWEQVEAIWRTMLRQWEVDNGCADFIEKGE